MATQQGTRRMWAMGEARGQWWASFRASPEQLDRLEAYVCTEQAADGLFAGDPEGEWGYAARLAFAVLGDDDPEDAFNRFWFEDFELDEDYRTALNNTAYLEGFVAGALRHRAKG